MAPTSSYYHLIIHLFFILTTNKISAQAYQNISLGTILTPLTNPTSWLSPTGDFAFGFRPLETDSSLFLLAVWYNKIANKTVVWAANRDSPVSSSSKLELTSNGSKLSLRDQKGREIWNPGVSNISYAASLDSGNFVLAGADSLIRWQSFDSPTDTILPGQVVNEGTSVYASILDNDYSTGRFVLAMQTDGNLVLYPVAYPTTYQHDPYWSSGTSGSGVQLKFNQSGSLYLSLGNNSVFTVMSTAVAAGDNYQRATLDSDGIFRWYSFPKNELDTGSWQVQGAVARNICGLVEWTGSGVCGFNSYCTLGSDGRVDCLCLPNYSFLDPDRKYKGCKPNFSPQSCEPGSELLYDFVTMSNAAWPLSNAEKFTDMTESDCRDNCLKDCFCPVASYESGTGTCLKKKYPLSNGNIANSIDWTVFVKYSKSNSTSSLPVGSSDRKRDWKPWAIAGLLMIASSIVLNIVQLGTCLYKRKRQQVPRRESSNILGPALHSFTYKELEKATNGFSELLGRGAFGTVYKGVVPDSNPKTLIAVKKLQAISEESEKDFTNEINSIGQTHHKNLVRLLGFCKEGENRLLVFEFMSNGSLNNFIFGPNWPDWPQRVQIAVGIAEGLAYLHEECRKQIIHCDIKPQNILLDENYTARISDFGLAKLLKLEQTRTSTGIRGTIGYFAPEWFKHVPVTTKVDVYSFGVMLLEIICCRRNFELGQQSMENHTVIDWAKECFVNGRLDLLVENNDEAKKDSVRLEKFVIVAISCVQDEPWLRPSMKKVVQMLEGSTEISIPPNMYSLN